jgi:hypothetical protein
MKAAFITAASRPDAVAGSNARQAASIDAWRKVFDREQMAALALFRPVTGSADSRDAEGSAPDHALERHACRQDKASSAPAGRQTDGAIEASASDAGRTAPAGMRSVAAVRAPFSTGTTTRAPAVIEPAGANAAEDVATPRCASPAALQPALADAGDAWPLRKLHARLGEDGIEVWLRDARLAPNDSALDADIAALRQTLREAGYRLARFTLNGIRLF